MRIAPPAVNHRSVAASSLKNQVDLSNTNVRFRTERCGKMAKSGKTITDVQLSSPLQFMWYGTRPCPRPSTHPDEARHAITPAFVYVLRNVSTDIAGVSTKFIVLMHYVEENEGRVSGASCPHTRVTVL